MTRSNKKTLSVWGIAITVTLFNVPANAISISDHSNNKPMTHQDSGMDLFNESRIQSVKTLNIKHAQSRSSNQTRLRSQSEVMREVKQRYNAKVLRISLNSQSTAYNVRVLMPSGKVKSLQVSARK